MNLLVLVHLGNLFVISALDKHISTKAPLPHKQVGVFFMHFFLNRCGLRFGNLKQLYKAETLRELTDEELRMYSDNI